MMSIMERIKKLIRLKVRKANKDNLPKELVREEYIITNGKMADQNNALEESEYEIVEKEILPEKMICPDCGGITLVGLEVCDKCGGELE